MGPTLQSMLLVVADFRFFANHRKQRGCTMPCSWTEVLDTSDGRSCQGFTLTTICGRTPRIMWALRASIHMLDRFFKTLARTMSTCHPTSLGSSGRVYSLSSTTILCMYCMVQAVPSKQSIHVVGCPHFVTR